MIPVFVLVLAGQTAPALDMAWKDVPLGDLKLPHAYFLCKRDDKSGNGLVSLSLEHGPEKSLVALDQYEGSGPPSVRFAKPLESLAYRKLPVGTDVKIHAANGGVSADIVVHLTGGVSVANLTWNQGLTTYTGNCTSIPLPPPPAPGKAP